MTLPALVLLLAFQARAADPPTYLREVKGPLDVGGLNENSRALADGIRRADLTNGGSVTGNLSLSGSLSPTSITFPDGTVQVSSPPAPSSSSVFSSATVNGILSIGNSGNAKYLDTGIAIWAKSVDGATQSSGCIVGVTMSGAVDTANAQFTSTTSATAFQVNNTGVYPGILLTPSCVPGTYCLVGIAGIFRVTSAGTFSGPFFTNSTTRCQIGSNGTTFDGLAYGYLMNTAGCTAGQPCWVRMR